MALAQAQPPMPDLRGFSPRQLEILDVVEQVFLRNGIRAVRIGELAAEASCSRSTLHELAPSKEDLLLLGSWRRCASTRRAAVRPADRRGP